MSRIAVLSLASLVALLGLAACTVYEQTPAYPGYAYAPGPYYAYPAPAYASSTFVFRGSFGDRGRPRPHHHWN
jgi:hypothetical protein